MDNSPLAEIERRHHHRLSEQVCIRIVFPGDSTVYKGRPSDLSSTGARIRFPRSVNVHQRLHVHILLPEKDIGCEGQVCWVRMMMDGRCVFGVRFMELADYDRGFLENALGKACIA